MTPHIFNAHISYYLYIYKVKLFFIYLSSSNLLRSNKFCIDITMIVNSVNFIKYWLDLLIIILSYINYLLY